MGGDLRIRRYRRKTFLGQNIPCVGTSCIEAEFPERRWVGCYYRSGQPGTITTYGETKSSSYLPFGNDQGVEPLVIVTDSARTRKSEMLINELNSKLADKHAPCWIEACCLMSTDARNSTAAASRNLNEAVRKRTLSLPRIESLKGDFASPKRGDG